MTSPARRENGLFFLPVVCFICIGLGAVFALLPAFEHEEFREGQRLRSEQARAAAEGAAALAVHRGADVEDLKIGAAVAEARIHDDTVTATATVVGPRGVKETFKVEMPSRTR